MTAIRAMMNLGVFMITLIGMIFATKLVQTNSEIRRQAYETPQVLPTLTPEPLISNFVDVFQQGTAGQCMTSSIDPSGSCPVDPTYFGVFTAQPIGTDLYVGISAGLPAEKDGGVLAKYSNGVLSPVLNADGKNAISEQGLHEIELDEETLYILGTDPVEPNDPQGEWSNGNVYSYVPGQDIIKHRNLENTMHSLGMLVDEGNLFVGTGSHTGDNATWDGRLYRSSDGGSSWTYVMAPDSFSNYRLWDVARLNQVMYGIGLSNDSGWTVPIFRKSVNDGLSWESIAGVLPYYRTRLLNYQNRLITKSYSNRGLWQYDGVNAPAEIQLPNGYYPFSDYVLNAMTVDSRGYLYVVVKRSTTGGSYSTIMDHLILRTNDLMNWQLVAQLPAEPYMLAYWPAYDQLLVSTNGTNATLWKIQLQNDLSLPPVEPIPTPTPVPPTLTPTPTTIPAAPITPVVSKEGKIMLGGFGPVTIANPDGSNQQIFVSNWETGDYFVAGSSWSIDGKLVALITRRYQSSDYSYNYRLFTKSYPDGVYEEWLPPQPKNISFTHPHLSPDNQTMYFSKNAGVQDNYGIYKINRGDTTIIPIIPAPARGKYLLGDISPDGSKILYYFGGDGYNPESEDIFIANTDGTNVVNLTNTPGHQELYPSFSPDGQKVFFYEHSLINPTYDLSVIDLNTKEKKFLNPTADLDESYACVSPSGSEIIYRGRTKTTPYVDSVYRANSDGSNVKQIISPINNNQWFDMHCWAPDPLAPTPTPTTKPSTIPVINTGTILPFKVQAEYTHYFVVNDLDGDDITATVENLPKKLVFEGCYKTSENVHRCNISGRILSQKDYVITITVTDDDGNSVVEDYKLIVRK